MPKKEINNPVLPKREDFGEGEFGDYCYSIILHGARCDAIIGDVQCKNKGIGTTDFDVLGDAEVLVHCSREHHLMIKTAVEEDLAKTGRNTIVGVNGRGRRAYKLYSPK